MKVKVILLTLLIASVIWIQGCECKPRAEALQSPCQAPQMTTAEQAYPAKRKGDVVMQKSVPEQIFVNQPFDYRIKVTNRSNQPVQNVMVHDVFSRDIEIQSSDPEFQRDEQGRIMWYLGDMQPEESKMIALVAKTSETADLGSCTKVTYDDTTCTRMAVVEPELKLMKSAPATAIQCDRIPISYTISNEGTGYACDIQIKESLPEGMMTSDGSSELVYTIDQLGPGESKTYDVALDASKPGEYTSKAMAMSRTAGEMHSNQTTVKVTKPMLTIKQSGPDKQFIGREMTYQITVSNEGDGVARDTMVSAMLPEFTQFGGATMGGEFTRSSPGRVNWSLGELQAGETKTVEMKLMANEEGTLESYAMAEAYCADQVSDSVKTSLEGISAIRLEVIDIDDPIVMGDNVQYVISVKNQGSRAQNNVQITCMLEDSMEYISSTGPTDASVSEAKITFAPLDRLAPKSTAEWRVTVKAVAEGDQRFKTMLNSDTLQRPVIETEATQFYE